MRRVCVVVEIVVAMFLCDITNHIAHCGEFCVAGATMRATLPV